MKSWHVMLLDLHFQMLGGATVTDVNEEVIYEEYLRHLDADEEPTEHKEYVVASMLAMEVTEELETSGNTLRPLGKCFWVWVGEKKNDNEAFVYAILLTRHDDGSVSTKIMSRDLKDLKIALNAVYSI